MSAEYSEDRLVQKTTADFFEQTLHWHSVYAHNRETYGLNGILGRKDQQEVILTRYLRQALEDLNPGHLDTAYEQAVDKLVSINVSKNLLQINQEKYKFICDGIRVSYRTDKGEIKDPLLKVIDFDNPKNNHFLVVRELWIQGSLYRRRPDIIGFVNGIPLLFIELKASNRNIQVAYEDNLTDYKDTIPGIFHHNAFILLSNGIAGRVGTMTSPFSFFNDWKRLAENETGRVDFETMLLGMCNKKDFLDIVQNFILFDNSSGSTYKILARNHQFLGVNRAFEAVEQRESRAGKLGVFWHTQGSGKSYSMAFLTEKIHRKLGGFTFLIVTDRQELDGQIVGTFSGVGAVPNDSTQATDGDHLEELLKQNPRYVFSLIHKFNKPQKKYSDRQNIIVISDEAHRTQYGKLADNMRHALPNASFLGFTGTPLMDSEEDQLTREVFGGYISTYDFQRAIEDGATVPLYYDNRGEKLSFYNDEGKQQTVATPDELNQRIAAELAKYNLNPEDEEKVFKRISRDDLILTTEKRLDCIAQDLVAHYTTRWETGKAMLVCLDKITVVRMHRLIDKYWKQAIANQEQRVQQATDEQDLLEQQRYLTWLTHTQYLVVISEAQNEVKTFHEYGLNIEPHRAIMKSRNLEEEFKQEKHPFRLAIVCAMWLTGFDVPTLATLYMDKPMKGHTLVQTIARANRVAEGKNNGLLVDYNGILKSLRAALATYAQSDRTSDSGTGDSSAEADSTPYNGLDKLLADYKNTIQACINHLTSLGFDLQHLIDAEGFDKLALLDKENADSAVNAVCTNDETRARFEVLAREVFKKKLALIAEPKLTEPYQAKHNAIDAIYKHLHEKQEIATNLNAVLRSLHGIVNDAISIQDNGQLPGADSGKIYDISNINFDLLKAEFAKSQTKNVSVQTLKEAVENQLKRMVRQNPLRVDLYTRYQQIIDAYNRETDRVLIEQTFEELLKLVESLSEEDSRAVREGLSEEYLAVFDLLCEKKNNLSHQTRNRIKQIAQDLIEAVKEELRHLENWRDKDTTQAQVKTFIHNYLYSDETGLPIDEYNETEVESLANVVFLHIFQQYASANRHLYSEAA